MRERIRSVVAILWREVLKFGIVGLAAFIVDVSLSNYLWGTDANPGPMHTSAVKAKAIATAVATCVAYFGNRYWTYRHRRRPAVHHEAALFFFFNLVGLLIAAGCVYFNDYVLGFTNPVGRNIAGNGVGLVLGTLFRFWAYRTYVFAPEHPGDPDEQAELAALDPAADAAALDRQPGAVEPTVDSSR